MDEPGGSRQCLVCSKSINSTRFGLDACRACSSFFKRTRITGKKYTCRQGDRKCATVKDEKFTCRGCRFDRCLAIGMEWDGPMRVRRNTTVSILIRIKSELKSLTERRREQELEIIKQHGGHKRFPHQKQELYYTHLDTSMEMYRIFIAESYGFFNNVFPAFSELDEREHELIFKDFIGKMGMVEGYQRSAQLWGGPNKYMMNAVTTCYEIEELHKNGLSDDFENKSSLLSYTRKVADEQKAILNPILNKCALTEQEYHALMALVMYEIDIGCDLSDEAEELLYNYQREVLENLQLYYKNELCLRNYATRLGNLMSANHAIQESMSVFKVFYRFYSTMFDVNSTENVMRDFHL